jgi:glycosyltransferase involved in cell wall biosynthesis
MNLVYLHMFNMGSGWGGSATVLLNLCGAFTAAGHRVRVVSARKPDPFGLTVCALPFEHEISFGRERRPGETLLDELSAADLRRMVDASVAVITDELLREDPPDLFIVNHISLGALICRQLRKTHGIPYRLIAHGTDTEYLMRTRHSTEFFSEAARCADCIFAFSAKVANEVQVTTGVEPILFGGVINSHVFFPPPREEDSAELRRGHSKLVYLGRLTSEKGVWVLLEAFQRQGAVQCLDIVGEGPLRPPLQEYIESHQLQDRVRLLGWVPQADLRELLWKYSTLVAPSIWEEPLGLVILEAHACGLPVIATRVGGIPECVEDMVTGVLVPPDDADALAAAIDMLCGSEERFAVIHEAVRRKNIRNYDDLARALLVTAPAEFA